MTVSSIFDRSIEIRRNSSASGLCPYIIPIGQILCSHKKIP